jgi:hypothetical protein
MLFSHLSHIVGVSIKFRKAADVKLYGQPCSHSGVTYGRGDANMRASAALR